MKVTKVYEIKLTISVRYGIFLQIDRCAEVIMTTAKNNLHIICIEVIICPVFRWYIFSLSKFYGFYFLHYRVIKCCP